MYKKRNYIYISEYKMSSTVPIGMIIIWTFNFNKIIIKLEGTLNILKTNKKKASVSFVIVK